MKKQVLIWSETDIYIETINFKCGHKHERIINEYVTEYCYFDFDRKEYLEHPDNYIKEIYDWSSMEYADEAGYEKVYGNNKENYINTSDKYIDVECLDCLAIMYASPYHHNTVAHGVSAFNRAGSVDEMLNRIVYIDEHPMAEICCSDTDHNCGPMGIWGNGDILASFAQDVRSYIDNYGHRRMSNHYIEEYNDFNEFKRDVLMVKENCTKRTSRHSEHWVRNININDIWVKKDYWKSLSIADKNKIKNFCCGRYELVII